MYHVAFSVRKLPRHRTLEQPCVAAAAAASLQSCPTLCDPIDGSPPGSPIPGILQARVLEWGAIAYSSHVLTSVKTRIIPGIATLGTL